MEANDMDLVRTYARERSEQAFRTLVDRHIHMVHAVALRQTAQPQLAEDVTQAVFIVLAEKAASLPPNTLLAGWLFRATRFAAANMRRAEARREHWEHKAAQMEPTPPPSGPELEPIEPLLNQALEQLPDRDRAAILLRFFEDKSMDEVGRALGTSGDAAKMRLSRAVEKLRLIFRKQGVVVSTAALLSVLSAQAAQMAPAGLAASVATAALLKQTSATTLPLVKGTLLLMAQTKSKTLLITAVALLLCGTTAVVVQQSLSRKSVSRNSAAPDAAPTADGAKPASTTTAAAARVLIFRDAPSWNRNPDFEDAMASMRIEHEVKPAEEMGRADLSSYRVVIIPGAQWKTDLYRQYTANAGRFERYVTNGGTLVLELNGAEDSGIILPRQVTMVKNGARENCLLVPGHPVLSPLGGKNIRANFASHGWLDGVPSDALVLATEAVNGQAATNRPTFVEYAHGAGRVIAACQCFHDQDNSGRGPLMETVIDYAMEKRWYTRKD